MGNENKIILGDFNIIMDKMDRDGGNKTQRLYRYHSKSPGYNANDNAKWANNAKTNHIMVSLLIWSLIIQLFFINNPFLTLAPKIVSAFLKNCPQKLFSNCLADGLLTSIV